jgi:hypothetical protein
MFSGLLVKRITIRTLTQTVKSAAPNFAGARNAGKKKETTRKCGGVLI